MQRLENEIRVLEKECGSLSDIKAIRKLRAKFCPCLWQADGKGGHAQLRTDIHSLVVLASVSSCFLCEYREELAVPHCYS